MKTVLHKSDTRGHANHGWLDTHHTFSFANYYNEERMHFGALRVLNDDFVDGGMALANIPTTIWRLYQFLCRVIWNIKTAWEIQQLLNRMMFRL